MSIGGLINGIFGTGGSSSGPISSSAWVSEPMNPASWGAGSLLIQQQQVTWQTILAGLVGTYSVIKAYGLQKRMVDLHERSVDQAEEYLELSKRHYDEISLPAFDRTRDHFDFVRNNWRPYVTTFIKEAFRLKEYAPDYDTQRGRAMSTVQAEFDKAQRMRARMRGRFEIGRACYENALFAIRAAEARVSAADRGYRYEDAKKIEMDKWYWQRWTHGAETASAAMANAISGINGAAATATTGLNAVGNAIGRFGEAASGLSEAQQSGSNFFSSLGNGAFRFINYQNNRAQMAQSMPASSAIATSAVQSIAAGATQGMAGIGATVIGQPGNTQLVRANNAGDGPY